MQLPKRNVLLLKKIYPIVIHLKKIILLINFKEKIYTSFTKQTNIPIKKYLKRNAKVTMLLNL